MNIYLFLNIILLFFGASNCYKYDTFYVNQKVDHFSYTTDDTFKMRFLVNTHYFTKNNGSVFFYTGNEGDIEMFANNTGFMWEYAKMFNAMLVFAEHRYYGKSLPYGESSYKDNQHLGYLSSEQALADFAYLITEIKLKIKGTADAPFVAFGGSYGGMLAAWFRMKYPHLVVGAYASSAPVLMFPGLTPCGKFYETVTKDFRRASTQCEKSIKMSWSVIRKVGSTETGRKDLTDIFNLCQPLNSSSSIDDLISWIVETWSYMAMLDYPYPTNFLLPLPSNPIKVACQYLSKALVDDIQLLRNVFKAASVYHNYTGDVPCFDFSSPEAKSLGVKGWDYQSCTEMVNPMCQTGLTDMFEPLPWNFTQYSENCWKNWRTNPDTSKGLYTYGGKNIKGASNIIFSNGELDPWSGLGVLENISPLLHAIYIEDAAHHLDLRSSNPADPISVINARKLSLTLIQKWIKDAQQS
ncbi:lysosomal Pro-X carboxypeptidase-like [Uloborus diversus]|uniref:lysosomal Pro-X carboxypeptidase-like n=1 Tax=Uloborus diversus TaxID=327109 RepID=UPI0024091218|nr:lysosomal Pro-X carboxypeptidase-like [Uloborus diversus]